jgi:hypothetical protein
MAHLGGNIDDCGALLRAARSFEHLSDGGLGGYEQRGDIEADHRIEAGIGNVQDRFWNTRAGIVDQNIKALQTCDVTSQCGSVGQIADYDGCFAAEAFYLPGGGFEGASRAAQEHEICPGFGQSGCNPGTYSSSGPGNHRHPIIETEAGKADFVGHG